VKKSVALRGSKLAEDRYCWFVVVNASNSGDEIVVQMAI